MFESDREVEQAEGETATQAATALGRRRSCCDAFVVKTIGKKDSSGGLNTPVDESAVEEGVGSVGWVLWR